MNSKHLFSNLRILQFAHLYLASCRLHLATCRLHLATCRLHLVTCRLHLATCRLHLATCRLHLASCILPFAFCLLVTPSVSAQNWKLFKKNDSLDCRFFLTDQLKNVYIITFKNELLKYDGEGYFDSRFSFKKFGKISFVDVSNPFKLILHYNDYQCVVILDAALNPIKTLFLNDMGVTNAGALAMSDAGQFWVYDTGLNKLLRFSVDAAGFKLANETSPLSMGRLETSQMLVQENIVYLNVPNKGIFMFDQFGKHIRTLDIKNATDLQLIESQLFYKQKDKYFRFNLQTLTTAPVNLPKDVSGDRYIQVQKGRLYAQRSTSIDVYDEK